MNYLKILISKIFFKLIFPSTLLLIVLITACNQSEQAGSDESEEIIENYMAVVPEWSKNANIYEVNIRQYTPEGTIKAFESHLPRLRNMGVDILWLMPIHPIGVEKRKGSMGSYYSVQDYKAVNPEFGTMEDFKAFVQTAHDMGFKVILDWVANHSAWDNQWIYDHPEWYTKDSTGQMIAPYDWTDVADLNYDEQAMRDAMIDALKFWVVETDIDGYRCDVASEVPTDFWEETRFELDQIKPVFMLAEAEKEDLHINSFDMTYAWELHSIFNQVAQGKKNANDIENYFIKTDSLYPPKAYRMNFITNHDENSWNGTVEVRMGDAAKVFAVLSYTLPGMPMIYSGQEVGLNKALKFFEKDEIDWDYNSQLIPYYTALNQIKKDNVALWNGSYGGEMTRINTTHDEEIFVFTRKKYDNELLVLANLSENKISTKLTDESVKGDYFNIITGQVVILEGNDDIPLDGWSYKIFKKQ